MNCTEFINTTQQFQLSEVTQAERVRLICHVQDCESCRDYMMALFLESGAIEPDEEIVNLIKLDKEIVP